jgi:hypothetical protein
MGTEDRQTYTDLRRRILDAAPSAQPHLHVELDGSFEWLLPTKRLGFIFGGGSYFVRRGRPVQSGELADMNLQQLIDCMLEEVTT